MELIQELLQELKEFVELHWIDTVDGGNKTVVGRETGVESACAPSAVTVDRTTPVSNRGKENESESDKDEESCSVKSSILEAAEQRIFENILSNLVHETIETVISEILEREYEKKSAPSSTCIPLEVEDERNTTDSCAARPGSDEIHPTKKRKIYHEIPNTDSNDEAKKGDNEDDDLDVSDTELKIVTEDDIYSATYHKLWLDRKKELEKEAERKARVTARQWQKERKSLKKIIDDSLKEYIDLYEKAHALYLQFEYEKTEWVNLFKSKEIAQSYGKHLLSQLLSSF